MPARSQITNMPGWEWIPKGEKPTHGFAARHAYNPSTGASLALRQAQAVQRGQQTVEQALEKAARPRRTHTVNFAPHSKGQTRLYRVRTFNTLYGAYLYASNAKPRSFILAKGFPYKRYPNEENESWRPLSPLEASSGYRASGIQTYYERFDNLLATSSVPEFTVWERLQDVGTYTP